MKRITLALVLALFVGACNLLDVSPGPKSAGTATNGTPSVNMRVDSAIGGPLYRGLCARCHGDSGQGTALAPVSIQGTANMWSVVHYGQGLMQGFPDLSDSDVRSIEVYLSQFKPTGIDALTGAQLYTMYCSRCHGDSAQGVVGKGVGIQGDSANVRKFVLNGGPTMPKYTSITDAQIAKLKQFLMTFTLPTDGAGMYTLYCASCHGASGEGVPGSGPAIQQDTTNIVSIVHTGSARMPANTTLTNDQINLIKAHIVTFPLPTDGKGLSMRFCASCHGTDGLGDSVKYPGIAEGQSDLVTATISGYYQRRSGLARMVAVAGVTSAQAQLIKSYMQSVTYVHTGQNVYNVNCMYCHPKADNAIRNSTASKMLSACRNGSDDMPSLPWVTSADCDSLYAWLHK